jgi:hypothetical protein
MVNSCSEPETSQPHCVTAKHPNTFSKRTLTVMGFDVQRLAFYRWLVQNGREPR